MQRQSFSFFINVQNYEGKFSTFNIIDKCLNPVFGVDVRNYFAVTFRTHFQSVFGHEFLVIVQLSVAEGVNCSALIFADEGLISV